MKYLFLLAVLAGCDAGPSSEPKSPHIFTCQTVGDGVGRCENSEVICYKYYGNNIQCKFKEND